jgi:hypothetical protein
VGDIEIGRAKRRRIIEEDIDEDRFYENHAGNLDFVSPPEAPAPRAPTAKPLRRPLPLPDGAAHPAEDPAAKAPRATAGAAALAAATWQLLL